MALDEVGSLVDGLRQEIRKVIVGQEEAVDLLAVALLAEGHVLIEGVPGTAKTLLARCFASALSLDFGRIQFTPDLMPGDVIGTNLFNFQTNEFTLSKGPIFTQVLLADEINRTPPKTQSALLQAMNERSVSIDGTDYQLGDGFMVLATQNPLEQQGTYPLPEAQLDRFLFKVIIDYPSREEEIAVVQRHGHQSAFNRLGDFGITSVSDLDGLIHRRRLVSQIRLSDDLVAYIVDLTRATREHPQLETGASPRAANMMAAAARAYAVVQGRDYVIPDDIKALFIPLMRHRVVLSPASEIDGITDEQALVQVLETVPAPK